MSTTILTDEQIDDAQEAAYHALVAQGYNGGMGGFQWDRASARAIEQAVLQSPEIQALREALRAAAEYIGDRSAGSSRFWELYDAAMEKQP